MCCRDASLRVPFPPCLLHNCRHSPVPIRSKVNTSAHIVSYCLYVLTCVSWSQVVWVACEEGLMVLRRQIHVVVSERLSTRYPCVTRQKIFQQNGRKRDGRKHSCNIEIKYFDWLKLSLYWQNRDQRTNRITATVQIMLFSLLRLTDYILLHEINLEDFSTLYIL